MFVRLSNGDLINVFHIVLIKPNVSGDRRPYSPTPSYLQDGDYTSIGPAVPTSNVPPKYEAYMSTVFTNGANTHPRMVPLSDEDYTNVMLAIEKTVGVL